MSGDLADLRSRFARAVAAAGATGDASSTFDALAARHDAPHRRYHTLTHVRACLELLDRFDGEAERREEVELALFFHDAVYDPRARDNEHRSADLARAELGALGVGEATLSRISRCIEATENHTGGEGDAALVLDLDLSILGSVPADFDAFEGQIREEYAHVAEAQFRAGRRRILQSFLLREEIFRVAPIRERFEERARANLERRIAELSRPEPA